MDKNAKEIRLQQLARLLVSGAMNEEERKEYDGLRKEQFGEYEQAFPTRLNTLAHCLRHCM